jgi:hypothetical protein
LEQNSSIDQSDFANKLEKLISVQDKMVKTSNFSQKEESKSMDVEYKDINEDFAGMVPETEAAVVEIEEGSMEEEMNLKDLVTEIVKEVMASMKTEMAVEDPEETEEVAEPEVEQAPDFASEKEAYETKIAELTEKLQAYEIKEKAAMMEKFAMLDSTFLEEVKASLDSYTIDQLEAKLSVEAVRSGLIFKAQKEEVTTYSVDFSNVESAPSWVIALEKKSK